MFQRALVATVVLALTYLAMTAMVGAIASSFNSSANMIAQATQGGR